MERKPIYKTVTHGQRAVISIASLVFLGEHHRHIELFLLRFQSLVVFKSLIAADLYALISPE